MFEYQFKVFNIQGVYNDKSWKLKVLNEKITKQLLCCKKIMFSLSEYVETTK